MKRFARKYLAAQAARLGSQALFVLPPRNRADAPALTRPGRMMAPRRRAGMTAAVQGLRPDVAACLYDRDSERLMRTLLELKAIDSKICNEGRPDQYAFLTGFAAERAIQRCEVTA